MHTPSTYTDTHTHIYRVQTLEKDLHFRKKVSLSKKAKQTAQSMLMSTSEKVFSLPVHLTLSCPSPSRHAPCNYRYRPI